MKTELEDRLESVRYASFWKRVAASLIDVVVLLPLTVVANVSASIGLYVGLSVLATVYKPLLEGGWGRTIGKQVMRLRIVNGQGNRMDWISAINRSAFVYLMLVPTVFTGVKQRQAGIYFDWGGLESYAERVKVFNEQNEILMTASSVTTVLWLVACFWLLYQPKKRALHDLMADSYVVQVDRLK